MSRNKQVYWSAISIPLIGFSTLLSAADRTMDCRTDCCLPEPPAPCYSLESPCCCQYCLGPENVAGNPAVRPKTCNGDFVITLAGFYWNAHQDGLDYALVTAAQPNVFLDVPSSGAAAGPVIPANPGNTQANIINGEYKSLRSHWRPGFKLGVGYDTTHDGWDVELLWTHYRGGSSSHIATQPTTMSVMAGNPLAATTANTFTSSIIPLWSALQSPFGGTQLVAEQIDAHWKVHVDLVDFELGREFWNSKYLSLRPHIGLRYARLQQAYDISMQGGSWAPPNNSTALPLPLNILIGTGEIDMKNHFKGFGVRGGFDSIWHLGCGFSLFGNVAMSLLYGRFNINQEEDVIGSTAPFSKTEVLSSKDNFRASKAGTDLALGVQYSTSFCNRYGFTVGLAWEHHMFFSQNQFKKVTRIGQVAYNNPVTVGGVTTQIHYPSGMNTFSESFGDLSTQGWLLNICLQF